VSAAIKTAAYMTEVFISPIGLHNEAVAAYEERRITP
jgi:hypothetical protein